MKKHFWDDWDDGVWITLILTIGAIIITGILCFS